MFSNKSLIFKIIIFKNKVSKRWYAVYFGINRMEWMMQILVFGLVLGIEGLNTAVEKIADFVHPDFHQRIGFIKDIAAGAVFFAALTALVIGCIIYFPYLF